MSRYEIAFSGQLAQGATLEQVEANLARLFQADAQRIALLFSGRRVVIKQGLDYPSVEKYREAMARAGAVAEVRAMPVEVEEIELAPPPAEEPAVSPVEAQTERLNVVPRDEYMAAFVDVDAPDFGIAPIGVDLQDARPPAQPPAVDLSKFNLAPPGSDLGEHRRSSDRQPPDTSHLKLVD